ncbi:hypothetical protein QBC39DRAFT_436292 [Podospora conica]|nr:hypothetical protein QBC39DRAFT_436292 [Schizothecium conicum]
MANMMDEIPSEFDASGRARRQLTADITTCVICGETIGFWRWFEDIDPPPSEPDWQGEFRAVPVSRGKGDKAYLTGVGYAPPNSASRHLTAPRDSRGRGCISTLRGTGSYGSRWIANVSFIDWRHDYGGMMVGKHNPRVSTYQPSWPFDGEPARIRRHHPLRPIYSMSAEVVSNLLPFPYMTVPAVEPPLPATKTVTVDPFSRLPLELMLPIAVELDTLSVKSLRLSSRFCWCLFYHDDFWRSRFLDHRRERAWLSISDNSVSFASRFLEATDGVVRQTLAWRDLYWLTGADRIPEQWKNRERVWKLATRLKMVLSIKKAPKALLPQSLLLMEGQWRWKDPAIGVFESANLSHAAAVPVPEDLCRMDFLFFGLGQVKHLVGIRLTGRDGAFVELGYRICDDDDNDLLQNGVGVRYFLLVPSPTLCGFVVAADEVGTRALSVVFGDGQVSKMIGEWCAEDLCSVSWRMASSAPSKILGATQDDHQRPLWRPLDNLTIWDSPGAGANEASGSVRHSLLGDGIWCPMRPGADTRIISKPSSTQDGTLFAVHFGGPGGEYLQNMTKLVIGCTNRGMGFLEVYYDIPVAPVWSKVGERLRSIEETINSLTIDGPGGERITAMHWGTTNATMHWQTANGDHDRLTWLRVFTNRNRSVFCCRRLSLHGDSGDRVVHRLQADPGCAVTGFFFVNSPRMARPMSFRPRGLLSRKLEAQPLEGKEKLVENAALYDCPVAMGAGCPKGEIDDSRGEEGIRTSWFSGCSFQ